MWLSCCSRTTTTIGKPIEKERGDLLDWYNERGIFPLSLCATMYVARTHIYIYIYKHAHNDPSTCHIYYRQKIVRPSERHVVCFFISFRDNCVRAWDGRVLLAFYCDSRTMMGGYIYAWCAIYSFVTRNLATAQFCGFSVFRCYESILELFMLFHFWEESSG